MKKHTIVFLIALFTLLIPCAVYAGPLTPLEEENDEIIQENDWEEEDDLFTITSGVNTEKESESTFDESRIISGTAQEGVTVEISICTKTSSGELRERDCYVTEVGLSGLFSQTVDLRLGENIIFITASKQDAETVEQEYKIKRKQRIIKEKLENSIFIPGESSVTGSRIISLQ